MHQRTYRRLRSELIDLRAGALCAALGQAGD